ncbi:MAG: StbB family protein [Aquabacterium sp.]
MKIAILNFSGNVGKTTIARHLLAPRLPKARLLSVESANADEGEADALRGTQFAMLQQALQVDNDLIVDIGASNIEDLLAGMQKYKGSHADFDYFVVPTVADAKQQRDTSNTVEKLSGIGVAPGRIRLVLNRIDATIPVAEQFSLLEQVLSAKAFCAFNPLCAITENEIYQLVKHDSRSLRELAEDTTDFKGLIAQAPTRQAKVDIAQGLAIKRLADGVLPELDACFKALALQ